MTREEFTLRQYELSVQTGMNQRYHQRYANFWWRWDTAIKIATAGAAVIGVILSVATYRTNASDCLTAWSLALSITTTIAAVGLNVVPFGSWEKDHRDYFRQWTDIREDLESLLFDCPGEPSAHDLCNFKKLDAKIHRLCGQEPAGNERFIAICSAAEERSRQSGELTIPPSWLEQWRDFFSRKRPAT